MCNSFILNQLNRLGQGWVSTFMDCMFDTNNKKGHLLHFKPFKIMVAYQTIHIFNSQWERISPSILWRPLILFVMCSFILKNGWFDKLIVYYAIGKYHGIPVVCSWKWQDFRKCALWIKKPEFVWNWSKMTTLPCECGNCQGSTVNPALPKDI